jgi:serine protease Do
VNEYLQAMGLIAGCVLGGVLLTNWISTRVKDSAPSKQAKMEVGAEGLMLLERLQEATEALATKVLPSVVAIDTMSTKYTDQVVLDANLRPKLLNREKTLETGVGSGVIVSSEGHILTNYHVLKGLDLKGGADKLEVWLHGGTQPEPVDVVDWNVAADIAVLKLKKTAGKTVTPLPWGDSGQVKMGNLVYAFGSPFGLAETMTAGHISHSYRKLSSAGDAVRYFQTDCVINPGNSGGPLVNVNGELIGINWAIYSDQSEDHSWQGVGLVLPANDVKAVYEGILEKKHAHLYLGLDFGEKTTAASRQVIITRVDSLSPAAVAGLRVGDVVTHVAGEAADSAVTAWKQVQNCRTSGKVEFTILRDQATKAIAVILGE